MTRSGTMHELSGSWSLRVVREQKEHIKTPRWSGGLFVLSEVACDGMKCVYNQFICFPASPTPCYSGLEWPNEWEPIFITIIKRVSSTRKRGCLNWGKKIEVYKLRRGQANRNSLLLKALWLMAKQRGSQYLWQGTEDLLKLYENNLCDFPKDPFQDLE